MQRNSTKCAHCGHLFYRLTEKTSVVNRSDETGFHVMLFSGPDPRSSASSGFYPGQLVCHFVYAHDRMGPQEDFLLVFILHAKKSRRDVLRQVENAADKIAELLQVGEKLQSIYTFDDAQFLPGFPK